MKAVLRDERGNVVDEYELPDHEYYEVRSPDGALICELSDEDGL